VARPPRTSGPAALLRLGQVYTQLEAPVGAFGKDTLRASTRALASNSAEGARYTRIENELQRLGARRDAVAARIPALLLGAAFDDRTVNVAQARALTRQGDRVLGARRSSPRNPPYAALARPVAAGPGLRLRRGPACRSSLW